jgi:hypothetical protein
MLIRSTCGDPQALFRTLTLMKWPSTRRVCAVPVKLAKFDAPFPRPV